MDTKLKNYRYSVWFKLLAIVLCVAGMLALAYGLSKAPYFEVAVRNTDFKESTETRNILSEAYYQVSEIAFTYRNEEYIKSGGTISDDYLRDKKNELINNRESAIEEINNKYNNLIQQRINNEITMESSDMDESPPSVANNPINDSNQITNTLTVEKYKEIQDVLKKYDESLKTIKADCINAELAEYHKKIENLDKSTGFFYTVLEADKVTLTNVNDYSKTSAEAFFYWLSLSFQFKQNNVHPISINTNANNKYYDTSNIPNDAVIYLGLSQTKYDTELATYNQNLKEGLLGIKISSIGLLAFLIGLIYLIYAAGRRPDKEGILLIFIDHVYLDVSLVVSVTAITLCLAALLEFNRYLFNSVDYINTNLLLVASGIIITIGTLIGILFVTMFSKRVKRHEVIKHSFIFKICRWIKHILIFKVCSWIVRKIKSVYAAFCSVFDRSPIAIRLVLIFGAYAVIITFLAFITIGLIITGSFGFLLSFTALVGVNAVAIYYLLKTFKTFKDIKNGAERIRAGELSYNIPEQGIPELRQLSETINKIADGLKTAVSSQVKSERMKAELITNVSHDLKTPLTSIITYVDLLKNEGLQSDNAEKYLGIIDSKSQRLKALTEDLFEAAKASSGNIAINFERLDIVSLINQGLGELSDKIAASGLDFRTTLPNEKLFVNADGKLLWRVIENLLSNVFKYAMPHSRVYIDTFTNTEKANVIIKNISAYELNVTEEELMERFKRGDASRHSEGSGLGLSIAKSLTELQGGNFHIEIDGDLFKATIELPKR